jgi:hypothetical protein
MLLTAVSLLEGFFSNVVPANGKGMLYFYTHTKVTFSTDHIFPSEVGALFPSL